jgi:hypothetical protein
MLQSRKVFCSTVNFQGAPNFESILLSPNLRQYVLSYRNKQIELSHVVDEGDIITCLFVATQTKDIAPIHLPGDEDDYSAVPIENGKGFAFPNVVLYIKSLKVLLWEVNRNGLLESGIDYYFNTVSGLRFNNTYQVSLAPVMNLDASTRLRGLLEMDSIEFQIAQPLTFLREEAGREGAMSDISKLVNQTNATQSVTIKLVADKTGANKLNPVGILSIVNKFLGLPHTDHGRVKNKLVIVGKSGDEESIIEETINFVADRFEMNFRIERLEIAPHLQVNERKEGIKLVYLDNVNIIRNLI